MTHLLQSHPCAEIGVQVLSSRNTWTSLRQGRGICDSVLLVLPVLTAPRPDGPAIVDLERSVLHATPLVVSFQEVRAVWILAHEKLLAR